MRTNLKKIGNSRGFTIPTAILEKLGWTEETSLEMEITDEGITFRKGIPDLTEMLLSVEKGLPDHETNFRPLRGKELR